jgi:hypothetical protein
MTKVVPISLSYVTITFDEILEANYVGNCLLGEPDLILVAWDSAFLGDL